jgi:ectoine hydroxylase-related dioxygenase (phytanoyl-CoA dioxygenase family)
VLAFDDSTHLLSDVDALRTRFRDDGYVFLRGVVATDVLSALRSAITSVCARHGWFRPGTDPIDARTAIEPCVEGDESYAIVYDEIQRLEELHAVPHDPSVARCMTSIVGDSAFPHPLSIARLAFPRTEWVTPPHQDYPNNQGTEDLVACWIPLGDCPVDLGGLSVLRGSHRFGVAPVDFALGAGNVEAQLDQRYAQLQWVGGDFELGDALVFHSLTVHRSQPNITDRLRLSVDYRFQREGEALTAGCLEPHFGRLSWEDVYRTWTRDDLKYYWRDKRYVVVPWDPQLRELTEDQIRQAVLTWLDWRPEIISGIAAAMRDGRTRGTGG